MTNRGGVGEASRTFDRISDGGEGQVQVIREEQHRTSDARPTSIVYALTALAVPFLGAAVLALGLAADLA